VDQLISHLPEHRKLALLADEPPPPAFNAFTIAPATYALRLSSLPPHSMVAGR